MILLRRFHLSAFRRTSVSRTFATCSILPSFVPFNPTSLYNAAQNHLACKTAWVTQGCHRNQEILRVSIVNLPTATPSSDRSSNPQPESSTSSKCQPLPLLSALLFPSRPPLKLEASDATSTVDVASHFITNKVFRDSVSPSLADAALNNGVECDGFNKAVRKALSNKKPLTSREAPW